MILEILILLVIAVFIIWASISGRKWSNHDHAAWTKRHQEYLRRLDINKTTDE